MLSHARTRLATPLLARAFASQVDAKQYDVVIAGGGVVGTALAACLAASPYFSDLSIALLEPAKPPSLEETVASDKRDLRVVALTPASIHLLKQCGAWELLPESRVGMFDGMQVWDTTGEGYVTFEPEPLGEEATLGRTVENSLLQAALFRAVRDADNVSVLSDKAVGLTLPAEDGSDARPWATLQLAEGGEMSTQVIIAADGAASPLRAAAGIGTWSFDYEQRGLVTTLRTDAAHSTAWQRFLPTGPLALLPLGGELSSIVWSTSPAEAARLAALPPQDFLDEFNSAMTAPAEAAGEPHWPLLAPLNTALEAVATAANMVAPQPKQLPPTAVEVVAPRASFPLAVAGAKRFTAPRFALAGDSAHRVHPMAGQGLNLGLADVALLNTLLEEAAKTGGDLGGELLLREYGSRRQADNVLMQAGMDVVKRVYSTDFFPLPAARAAGMSLLNAVPPARWALSRLASGSGLFSQKS
eukprot:PLAT4421.3.p1 GENE.PLAT4421.3~~PLAT4421.3.p1  ORF type:complete len:472 (+),score=166.49 PLAT4421.3:30-1445(+)